MNLGFFTLRSMESLFSVVHPVIEQDGALYQDGGDFKNGCSVYKRDCGLEMRTERSCWLHFLLDGALLN